MSRITVGKVEPMAQRTHPHAEATYRVVPSHDGAFAVEVSIPESYPAKVSIFATEADAEVWIAEHRRRIQSENEPSRWFRTSGSSEANGRGRPGSSVAGGRRPI
jgi:hypothetical protein